MVLVSVEVFIQLVHYNELVVRKRYHTVHWPYLDAVEADSTDLEAEHDIAVTGIGEVVEDSTVSGIIRVIGRGNVVHYHMQV